MEQTYTSVMKQTTSLEVPKAGEGMGGRVRRKSSAGHTKHVTEGWREFERRMEIIRTQQRADGFDLEEVLPKCLVNKYKNRDRVDGTILHYAIEKDCIAEREADDSATDEFRPMHWQSAVEMVLNAGAHPDSLASYMADHEEAKFAPVHLASGLGSVSALYELVRHGADVNQKTTRGGQEHYCAIHEASFLHQSETVETLIALKANVNVTNKLGETPLHIIAKNGDAEIAKMLVEAGARLDARLPVGKPTEHHRHSIFEKVTVDLVTTSPSLLDDEPNLGKTPLEVAICGDRRFPKDKLHWLAPFCNPGYEDHELLPCILEMCNANRPAASELIRSLITQAAADPNRRSLLVNQFKQSPNIITKFASLMRLAPEVALDIMELMNDEPKAVAPEYHALPTMSNFEEKVDWVFAFQPHIQSVHTVYETDSQWKYDPQLTSALKYPPWHETFAPKPQGSFNDFEVSIKVLHIPNVLDLRIFNALNTLRSGNEDIYERAFSKAVVRGMVHCTWKCVNRSVYFCICVDILVVAILSNWAFADKVEGRGGLQFRVEEYRTFAFLFACVFHELVIWIYVLINCQLWGFHARSRLTSTGILELAITVILGVYVVWWQIWQEGQVSALLFCVNVLFRWFKLAHMLRLVSGLGDKILAITSSVFPMAEFFIFAILIWCAFLSAFASIRGKNSVKEVQMALFFVVFSGDPEAFANLEGFDANKNIVFGLVCLVTLFFSVAILNLMIGMYGNMFSTMEAKSTILFLQERCWAVEHTMLSVVWPFHEKSYPTGSKLGDMLASRRVGPRLLSFLLVVVWILLPATGALLELVGSAMVLAAAMLLAKSSLVDISKFNRDLEPRQVRRFKQEGCWYHALDGSRSISFRSSRDSSISAQDSDSSRDAGSEEFEVESSAFFLWMCHRVSQDAKKEPLEMMVEKYCDGVDSRLKELDKKLECLTTDLKDFRKSSGMRMHGSMVSVRSGTGRRGSYDRQHRTSSLAELVTPGSGTFALGHAAPAPD